MSLSTPAPASRNRTGRYSSSETLAMADAGSRYRVTGLFYSLARARCLDLGCEEGVEITCVENRDGFVTVERSDGRRVRLEREQAWFVRVEPIRRPPTTTR